MARFGSVCRLIARVAVPAFLIAALAVGSAGAARASAANHEGTIGTGKVHARLQPRHHHRARHRHSRTAHRAKARSTASSPKFDEQKFLASLRLPGALKDGRGERWAVKTGADSDAHLIFRTGVPQNVEDIAATPALPYVENTATRYAPYETTAWTVEGHIVAFGIAPDGDYVLVIKGLRPGDLTGQVAEQYKALKTRAQYVDTVIARLPDPNLVSHFSPWQSNIEASRSDFDSEFTGVRHPKRYMRRLLYPVKVRVTGVGFFDRDRTQVGRAPNQLSLHPVLKIEMENQPTDQTTK